MITPPKSKMEPENGKTEPENGPLEEEIPLENHHSSGYNVRFSGESLSTYHFAMRFLQLQKDN